MGPSLSNSRLRHLMIIAGEASGDKHGASLIYHLKAKDPTLRFTGLGGPLMRSAGQEQLYDIKGLAVLGLTEVLKKIFFFRRVFFETLNFLKRERPDALVLIDYPGFNVRLAEKAHREKIKVIYYISPQVWAWGKERVGRLRQTIEKMLVVFPFEEEIYRREGVPVKFVGHPLLDELELSSSSDELRSGFGLKPGELAIALLPGSRLQEIKLILPVMLETAFLLKGKFKVKFLLPVAPAINREIIEKALGRYTLPLKIVEGESIKVIAASDLVITASGTATLETAILGRPMVIIYKVPFLSYLVLKRLLKVPCIGMVNILLQEKVFPEFIQYEAKADNIFKACARILEDRLYRDKMLDSLNKIRGLLGGPGASSRAAQEIWSLAYGHN